MSELTNQLRQSADSGDSDGGTSALMRKAAEHIELLERSLAMLCKQEPEPAESIPDRAHLAEEADECDCDQHFGTNIRRAWRGLAGKATI